MKSNHKCVTSVACVSALALAGCSGGSEFSDELDLGAAEQGINAGVEVASNVAPFNSVVRLITLAGERGDGLCSGLKLPAIQGTDTFLTAAHCLRRANGTYVGVGDRIDINNALVTIGQGTNVTLSAVFIHPSYIADPQQSLSVASEHSYDVALFQTNTATTQIPAANAFFPTHIADGQAAMQVGYGADNSLEFDTHVFRKQSARYTAASQQTTGDSAARYAHQILTFETGAGRQSLAGGDSGGPLFRETSTGSNVWRVMGIAQGSNSRDSYEDPGISGFARLANVGRWLAAPHNRSLTLPLSGIGFLQQRASKCASGGNLGDGTQLTLAECEGYDVALHPELWQVVPVAGTSFYTIKSPRSGVNRCWDVTPPAGGIPPISSVLLKPCTTGRQQQHWLFTATHAGTAQAGLYYSITNRTIASGAVRPNGSSLVVKTEAFFPDNQDFMFYR